MLRGLNLASTVSSSAAAAGTPDSLLISPLASSRVLIWLLLQISFAPTHPQPIKGFGLHIRLLQIHSAALLRSLHNCTPTCNLRIVFRVALPTISIHCCWLKNKRKIQIGSHITAIQPTLYCSLMLGVHMVAVKGSLVLFTGPCQPVNGQLSLLLPALTMVHSSIVFWALWF